MLDRAELNIYIPQEDKPRIQRNSGFREMCGIASDRLAATLSVRALTKSTLKRTERRCYMCYKYRGALEFESRPQTSFPSIY